MIAVSAGSLTRNTPYYAKASKGRPTHRCADTLPNAAGQINALSVSKTFSNLF